MCGIAGICQKGSSPQHLLSVVSGMCNLLKHRGPDDEGYVLIGEKALPLAGNDTPDSVVNSGFRHFPASKVISTDFNEASIALGHRRLSVIDLSPAGHQPFTNADGSVWLVYNGEIYNYIELRNELKGLGRSFFSNCDTEVLFQAYEQWGIDCLKRLNGMWSFVLYDMRKHILWGARDRFGVKPFYYRHDQKGLTFASEQKAFYAVPDFRPAINPRAVFDYLLMHRVEYQEEGFLNTIIELNPGCDFLYSPDTNKLTIRKYYELPVNSSLERFDKQKSLTYIKNIRQLVENAVRIRLRSDIPVGFCLSGGIDSSTLVSCSNYLSKGGQWDGRGEMVAFTAVNGSEGFDEIQWARKVAQKTGCRLIEAPCTDVDLLAKLRDIIQYQDIPLLSSGTYAQYRVMEVAAQEGIHLLLDGQGADELFAGYPVFLPAHYAEMLKGADFTNLYKQLKHYPKEFIPFSTFMLMQAKRGLDRIVPDFLVRNLAPIFRPEIQFIKNDLWQNMRNNFSFASENFESGLNNHLAQYYTGNNLKTLLRFEDRCAMRFSVESRTPFADDLPLTEYLFSLPSIYKINEGYTKWLLRESMRGVLPDEVRLRRDKLGFATPLTDWMCKSNDSIKQIIAGSNQNDDYIQYRQIIAKWDKEFAPEALRKHPRNAMFLWRSLNFLLWKQIFIP